MRIVHPAADLSFPGRHSTDSNVDDLVLDLIPGSIKYRYISSSTVLNQLH